MSSSLSRLEPYLLLAKSARGASAAQLVLEATAAPGVYVFSELLAMDSVKDLANTHAAHHKLLCLFAYGTLSDWASSPSSFPSLKPAHLTKLRHLTLATLASRARIVPYATLLAELQMDVQPDGTRAASSGSSAAPNANNIREMEDLIIDAVYAGVLGARLDQRAQRMEVEGCIGRDVSSDKAIESMEKQLGDWSATTQTLLRTLQERIDRVRAQDAHAVAMRAEHTEAMERTLNSVLNPINNSSNNTGGHSSAGGGLFGASSQNAASMQDVEESPRRGAPQRKRTRA